MNSPLQLSLVTYKKNAYIIVEGKANADYFYIIREGKVRVSKEVQVVEEEGGNVLNPGDFFGVVATMSSHSHIETAQALTDVVLIAVHRDQYGLLIERNAPVAMKIIMQFSRKMRYLDEALTKITLKSIAVANYEHLFNVAEYYARQSKYNLAYYAYHQYITCCPGGINVPMAKERMGKIRPYANAVYLNPKNDEFTRKYPKDTMVFSESQPGKELYIIQKGSIKISKIVNQNEVLLAVLKSGDIFGEMSLLENQPRSASAIANEDSVLMAINLDNFQRMVSSQPQMIVRLTQLLSERIWTLYKQLANTQLSDPLGRLYDALSIQLEKLRVPINSQPYVFDFGPVDLLNMVGMPKDEGALIIRKFFTNPKLKIINNRIHLTDKEEVDKQAKYFRKMEKIEQARKAGSMKNM
ncbi:MAG: cyclic nucleotide-binding domain-containing protein [Spirochaetales bacterium]|jgi:CRP-like cAMP-binding protein|nr:cyclic nucleotide-binding domain-containing protein [Spirochaetales bacterium]